MIESPINTDALKRNEEEKPIDYVNRVCSLKDSYGLTWEQVATIINENSGLSFSESKYRKYWKKKQREVGFNSEEQDEECHDEIADKVNELRKERFKLSDEIRQNNAFLRRVSREETIKEIAHEYASVMNKEKILFKDDTDVQWYSSPALISDGNKAILQISDWHYGIEINNAWNTFNTEIAKERVSKLLEETIRRCKKENVKEIYVVNLGDLISGRIHLPLRLQSRIDAVTQIMEVSEILAEFLAELAEHNLFVTYHDCLDNHSRVEPNKSDSLDLESLARITTWYLQERVGKKVKIVSENPFGEDIITFNIPVDDREYSVACVHGNKDKPNKVVENLTLMTRHTYDLILTAHMHHFSCDERNECVVVSNGSLMGTDVYAQSLRLSSKPSQNLIILNRNSVVDSIQRIIL